MLDERFAPAIVKLKGRQQVPTCSSPVRSPPRPLQERSRTGSTTKHSTFGRPALTMTGASTFRIVDDTYRIVQVIPYPK